MWNTTRIKYIELITTCGSTGKFDLTIEAYHLNFRLDSEILKKFHISDRIHRIKIEFDKSLPIFCQ